VSARACDRLTYEGQADDGLDAGHGGLAEGLRDDRVVLEGAPTVRGSILGPAKMRGCCDMGVCLVDAGW
jgi:hypothetical protein